MQPPEMVQLGSLAVPKTVAFAAVVQVFLATTTAFLLWPVVTAPDGPPTWMARFRRAIAWLCVCLCFCWAFIIGVLWVLSEKRMLIQ